MRKYARKLRLMQCCSVAGKAEGSQGDAHGAVEEKWGQSQGADGEDFQGRRNCRRCSPVAIIEARERAISSKLQG